MEQHERGELVVTSDERHLVLAANSLGLLRSSSWPDVAAQLLARGLDGEATGTMACLSRHDSPWTIEPFVAEVVDELGGAELLDIEAGSRLVGRAVARVAVRTVRADSCAAVRVLAALSPGLDYPSGTIGTAYSLAEWLDCDCHEGSVERAAAVALETALRDEPLDVAVALLDAVTEGWSTGGVS